MIMKFSFFLEVSRVKARKKWMSGQVNIKKQFSLNFGKFLSWHDLKNPLSNSVDNCFI